LLEVMPTPSALIIRGCESRLAGSDANAFGVNYHSVVNRVLLGSDANAFVISYREQILSDVL